MNKNKVQIIEMFRKIYYIDDNESLEIYNKFLKNKSNVELKIIENKLLDVIKKKNEILKKLSLDIGKNINKFDEQREREEEMKDFNI